jgi:hypothetical protein
MNNVTYRGVVKGKTIELDEPLPYPEGQPVTVSVEPVSPAFALGSPAAILDAMRRLPHLRAEDVDELERAINEGKLPVH